MRIGHHGRANELLIAQVSGLLANHAVRKPVNVAAAVAAIHEVTTDPHLLGHAWCWPPQYKVFEDPWADIKNEILGAAGADPQHPDRITAC